MTLHYSDEKRTQNSAPTWSERRCSPLVDVSSKKEKRTGNLLAVWSFATPSSDSSGGRQRRRKPSLDMLDGQTFCCLISLIDELISITGNDACLSVILTTSVDLPSRMHYWRVLWHFQPSQLVKVIRIFIYWGSWYNLSMTRSRYSCLIGPSMWIGMVDHTFRLSSIRSCWICTGRPGLMLIKFGNSSIATGSLMNSILMKIESPSM